MYDIVYIYIYTYVIYIWFDGIYFETRTNYEQLC